MFNKNGKRLMQGLVGHAKTVKKFWKKLEKRDREFIVFLVISLIIIFAPIP